MRRVIRTQRPFSGRVSISQSESSTLTVSSSVSASNRGGDPLIPSVRACGVSAYAMSFALIAAGMGTSTRTSTES